MVKIGFEIDGKLIDINTKFNIFFTIGNDTIQPLQFTNGFIVPFFENIKEIDTHIQYRKHKLLFSKLPSGKFETNWTVGITNKPKEKDISESYYIKFTPIKGGLGTYLRVKVSK